MLKKFHIFRFRVAQQAIQHRHKSGILYLGPSKFLCLVPQQRYPSSNALEDTVLIHLQSMGDIGFIPRQMALLGLRPEVIDEVESQ